MSSTGVKYRILTHEEFDKIKTLHGMNLSNKQIQSILGNNRSTHTIAKIRHFDTLETYRKACSDAQAETASRNPSKLELANDGAVQPRVPSIVSVTDSQLVRIANALERLADAWESAPKKRSLFN